MFSLSRRTPLLFWRSASSPLDDLAEVPTELAEIGPELDDAIDRLGRDLVKNHPRRGTHQPRVGPLPTRLPAPHVGRPVSRPLALPQRLSAVAPSTALERRRMEQARRRGGSPPLAAAVEEGAEKAADLLRDQLRDLQRGLGRLQWRSARRRR